MFFQDGLTGSAWGDWANYIWTFGVFFFNMDHVLLAGELRAITLGRISVPRLFSATWSFHHHVQLLSAVFS